MRALCSLIFFLIITTATDAQQISIIPQPAQIQTGSGNFTITDQTVITASDEQDRASAQYFNDYLKEMTGISLQTGTHAERSNQIRIVTRKFIQAPEKDAYVLKINKDGITIEGDTYAGTFYGIQTLIQMLPVSGISAGKDLALPFVTINDHPRFSYRGMHLDVSRHFFPASFIKKYIDYLALHKLNFFHWHLTEDQGWRIEIKKYPLLTEIGAYRNGTIIGRYPGTGNDDTRYGGFYTQEEVREIVKYAKDRHVTIVPEIEMPGHSSAAIAAYPWLSCFPDEPTKIATHPSPTSVHQQSQGRIKLVQETWGVFDDVFCAGRDSTFRFLQDVLDEVIPLFPSSYIHVGGDECPKSNWKRCPDCQARIKKEGLKDEHELQSYFIRRMEQYINGKGKILIGWDEILEGGLAPNAVVMSWRGEQGGIEAAKEKHKVIMTPQKPMYFDHSQTKNEDSVVIGGFNPIEEVYAYNPIPGELKGEPAKYVLGAQANLWTEYVKNEEKLEYMIFPRMSALAEVLWTPLEKKNWSDFEKRLAVQFRRYDQWKVNYSKAFYDIRVSLSPAPGYSGLKLSAVPRDKGGVIRVVTNGKNSVVYSKPVVLTKGSDLAITYSRNGELVSSLPLSISFNKATGKKVSIRHAPSANYPGQGGAFSLVNGIYSNKGLSYPDWLGWTGDDMIAVIDLGKKESFSKVRVHTLNQGGSWVYLPRYVEVMVSDDGKKYRPAGKSSTFVQDHLTMGWITVPFSKRSARFIKVIAKNYGVIPEGQQGAGNKAWLFADEIQVN